MKWSGPSSGISFSSAFILSSECILRTVVYAQEAKFSAYAPPWGEMVGSALRGRWYPVPDT